MKRNYIWGLVGIAIVIGGIFLYHSFNQETPPPVVKLELKTSPVQSKTEKTKIGPDKIKKQANVSARNKSNKIAPPSGQKLKEKNTPSFDIVRVNPVGQAVIAGRGSPDSIVTVRDKENVVGTIKTDTSGAWVLVPKEPIKPGKRVLSLSEETTSGKIKTAKKKVILVVPEAGKDIAGKKTNTSSGTLAVLVPQKGTGPTTVLQRPNELNTGDVNRKGQINKSGLSVDTVDYDDDGQVTVGGKSNPGAALNLYLDNKFSGKTIASDKGVWHIIPQKTLKPGLYNLRIDQLNKSGKVIARVETRFARAGIITSVIEEGVFLVQPGNSLWRIARKAYGRGNHYTVIYKANVDQIRNPDLIYPGQLFLVPNLK
ncbi:MAG: LysM peptidoglycan-binding domain-containing protein [Pseudomonadota bacterium]|nr:LysM peptidoglycan-binding domain-containing protein [Pseudomonadota bacterium]